MKPPNIITGARVAKEWLEARNHTKFIKNILPEAKKNLAECLGCKTDNLDIGPDSRAGTLTLKKGDGSHFSKADANALSACLVDGAPVAIEEKDGAIVIHGKGKTSDIMLAYFADRNNFKAQKTHENSKRARER